MKLGISGYTMVQVGRVDTKMVLGSGDLNLTPGVHVLELRYTQHGWGKTTYGFRTCSVVLQAEANHTYAARGELSPAWYDVLLPDTCTWVGWIEDASTGARHECRFEQP